MGGGVVVGEEGEVCLDEMKEALFVQAAVAVAGRTHSPRYL